MVVAGEGWEALKRVIEGCIPLLSLAHIRMTCILFRASDTVQSMCLLLRVGNREDLVQEEMLSPLQLIGSVPKWDEV